MMAPMPARRPSSPRPVTTVVRVESEANEMPCARDNCEPKSGTPRVCSAVAAPLTNRAHETSRVIWGPESPAAPPMMGP